MEKQKNPGMNMLQLPKLSHHKSLTHGFTTKYAGDLHLVEENRPATKKFWEELSTDPLAVTSFKQTHSAHVAVINSSHRGTRVLGYDGGVTREKDIVLAINTADCVPVLFYEKKHGIIGAVHAGWKGIVGGIITNAIEQILSIGGDVDEIKITIGPHIGACCYEFSKDGVKAFEGRYEGEDQVHFTIDDHIYVDVGKAAYIDAVRCGIALENIDYYVGCTKCQEDTFFSYRRSNKKLDGEMVSFIGMR